MLVEQFPHENPNPAIYESVLWDPRGAEKYPAFATFPKAIGRLCGRSCGPSLIDEGRPFTYGIRPGDLANDMFGQPVASLLFSMIRHLRPSTVTEIGAGYSTYAANKALTQNQALHGQAYDHVIIEPYRSAVLEHLQSEISILNTVVQTVEPSFFARNLRENDVLFIDLRMWCGSSATLSLSRNDKFGFGSPLDASLATQVRAYYGDNGAQGCNYSLLGIPTPDFIGQRWVKCHPLAWVAVTLDDLLEWRPKMEALKNKEFECTLLHPLLTCTTPLAARGEEKTSLWTQGKSVG